jgi:hypothetical protein
VREEGRRSFHGDKYALDGPVVPVILPL